MSRLTAFSTTPRLRVLNNVTTSGLREALNQGEQVISTKLVRVMSSEAMSCLRVALDQGGQGITTSD